MKTHRHASVRDLVADYRQHEKAELDKRESWGYFVMRPLSFYPTALFLRLGVSANQATWISIAVLGLSSAMLAIGGQASTLVGAFLANCWLVLDFVDGNIARYQKSPSRYGEFLDSMGGYVAFLLFFFVGLGGYRNPESMFASRAFGGQLEVDRSLVLVFGAWASLSQLWTRLVYQKFKNSFGDQSFERYDVLGTSGGPSMLKTLFSLGNDIFDLSGLLLPILFLSALLNILDVFLLVVATANTVMLVVSVVRIVRVASSHGGIPQ